MIRSDKQHLFPERERREGGGGRKEGEGRRGRESGMGSSMRERETAEKPVKPRQQGPACKKVKGERRGCVWEGTLCSVTQWRKEDEKYSRSERKTDRGEKSDRVEGVEKPGRL